MRQYEPVWQAVKTNLMCDISAHRLHHRRIIKAVIKEKDMDLGFKLECSERSPPVQAILQLKRSGSIISFTINFVPIRKPRVYITLDSI